jgi:hypothetical protein
MNQLDLMATIWFLAVLTVFGSMFVLIVIQEWIKQHGR